ncbi:MAG: SPASM domain-containing protein [Planctomycetota bacterium]
MRSNLGHLDGFVRHAAEIGADAVILQLMRHFAKASPDEDPLVDEDGAVVEAGRPDVLAHRALPDDVVAAFDAARRASVEVGVNVYFVDFGVAPSEPNDLRSRVEDLSGNASGCWSLMRNVSIFDTGDVFPCCHPTEYRFGNVADAGARTLERRGRARPRNFERRETLYCSGCISAPYMPNESASAERRSLELHRLRARTRGVVERTRPGSGEGAPVDGLRRVDRGTGTRRAWGSAKLHAIVPTRRPSSSPPSSRSPRSRNPTHRTVRRRSSRRPSGTRRHRVDSC